MSTTPIITPKSVAVTTAKTTVVVQSVIVVNQVLNVTGTVNGTKVSVSVPRTKIDALPADADRLKAFAVALQQKSKITAKTVYPTGPVSL